MYFCDFKVENYGYFRSNLKFKENVLETGNFHVLYIKHWRTFPKYGNK